MLATHPISTTTQPHDHTTRTTHVGSQTSDQIEDLRKQLAHRLVPAQEPLKGQEAAELLNYRPLRERTSVSVVMKVGGAVQLYLALRQRRGPPNWTALLSGCCHPYCERAQLSVVMA